MAEVVPEEVLLAFGMSGAEVTMFERGLINRHWLVVGGIGRAVIRRYNPLRTRDAIGWEQALVSHAAYKGWPVPLAISPTQGGGIVEHHGRLWSAHRFLEGEANLAPGMETIRRQGELLARLHLDMADFDVHGQRPTFGEASELDAWTGAVAGERFDDVLSVFAREYPELTARIRESRAQNQRELANGGFWDLPRLPVHGDFHRYNLLWTGEELTGLLDFDFARLDAQVCDLGTMLAPFMPLEPAPAGALLEGYNSVRQLSEIEWELLPTLARGALLWWIALLVAGWGTGRDGAAIEAITRTTMVRLPAADAAEAGWRAAWGRIRS